MKRHILQFSILIALFGIPMLLVQSALCEPTLHILFEPDGTQNPDYSDIIKDLELGDHLRFSNGREVTVVDILDREGNGNTTKIIRTSETRVFRIPLSSGDFERNGFKIPYINYIGWFWTGHRKIERFGVDVVNAFSFLKGEYVEVEYFPSQFTLTELLSGKIIVTADEKERLIEDLIRWIKTTSNVTWIADASIRQIGFDGSQWKLLDFRESVTGLKKYMRENDISDDQVPVDTIFSNDHRLKYMAGNDVFSREELDKIQGDMWEAVTKERLDRIKRICPLK